MANRDNTEDYYATLEVPPDASEATIRANYRRLALLKHPDKNPSNPNATVDFQRINAAYECLKDPHKRYAYDHCRKEAQSEFNRRAREGENEINLIKKKIAFLKKVLYALSVNIEAMKKDRREKRARLGTIMTELGIASPFDTPAIPAARDPGAGANDSEALVKEMGRLVYSLSQLDEHLLVSELEHIDTELRLVLLAQEFQRQQWPTRASPQTARQAEAEAMQEDQRRRTAKQKEKDLQQKRQARESQQEANQRKKEARRREREEKEAAKAKAERCKHTPIWHSLKGNYTCQYCYKAARKHAWRCPICLQIACKECRNKLKNQK
ncbi:hypothetical protein JX265_005633 [Neoarthrinium moseri]|uniref:J domain-containing protein n=1 Tax=Neoarthrinium moseri TaxID=1658444 RepID=A0A9Q0AMF3_9PEZI|nr:hypothetical protein JX265_005633 [Neoarthrinium moseri]